MTEIKVLASVPTDAKVVAMGVSTTGPMPRGLGMTRKDLSAHGFDAKSGQTFFVPRAGGHGTLLVGLGDSKSVTANSLRNAGAAIARATTKVETVATTLLNDTRVEKRAAAQAIVEGYRLALHRYVDLKKDKSGVASTSRFVLVTSANAASAKTGVLRGQATANATCFARDLANTPPAHLTARMISDLAVAHAADAGLKVEVFNKDQLKQMGCGGMIGVNKGSVEPPRMVRLTWKPKGATGHVALVGKGVMYDSGGISLKPSDPSHASMKMDMSGAAAVLATMLSLKALNVKTAVTGYLMCTDNMPSGSALKLGDVLTMRNGKTVEIHNTDAEGRLILADGLSLAAEQKPHAIVDIATLTGACLVALGEKVAGALTNNDELFAQIKKSSERVDEPVWQLPLVKDYRRLLDSNVADMRNIGGPSGGTITAALFLSEFVNDIPWVHLDIAGPMKVDGDEGWMNRGATAFGTRLLIDFVANFKRR